MFQSDQDTRKGLLMWMPKPGSHPPDSATKPCMKLVLADFLEMLKS